MALSLSEKQLEKLNKKDLLTLLLESMRSEEELRQQLSALTAELQRTNQQMQILLEKWNLAQANRFGRSSEKMNYDDQTYQQMELAVMYAQCFNEAEASVNGVSPEEPAMEEVTVSAHSRRKHAGKREEDKMLFAVNKWLIGHPEGGLPEGAFIGLKGENLTLE